MPRLLTIVAGHATDPPQAGRVAPAAGTLPTITGPQMGSATKGIRTSDPEEEGRIPSQKTLLK